MYRLKHMWATTYIRGTFFAEMLTTQRCDSLNAILKKYCKRKVKLYRFVDEMDVFQIRIRNNELVGYYKSRHIALELSSHIQVYKSHSTYIGVYNQVNHKFHLHDTS